MTGYAMNKFARPIGTATYQDVLDAPENMVAEIIYGSLYTQPRPAPKHAFVETALSMEIGQPFQKGKNGPGGWIILAETEVQFGTDILVPDIAGWRRERLPNLPDENSIRVIPDWVCEVISPSSETRDRVDKREIYADYGVKHIWLIDPIARTLEAFACQDGTIALIATLKDDDPVSVAPFDAISFALDDLWA